MCGGDENTAFILYERQIKKVGVADNEIKGVALDWRVANNWVKENPSNRFFKTVEIKE